MVCRNCSFKCIASDCDCVCHTQSKAFNYGFKEGKKEGAIAFGNKIIDIIKLMPNADDRLPNNLLVFDGGSVHKFTLIDKIKELQGVKK